MNLRVAVLGGGSWGTTVATLASHNAPTVLWARRAETVIEVNEQHTNERYLPGARLPEDLRATGSARWKPSSEVDSFCVGRSLAGTRGATGGAHIARSNPLREKPTVHRDTLRRRSVRGEPHKPGMN